MATSAVRSGRIIVALLQPSGRHVRVDADVAMAAQADTRGLSRVRQALVDPPGVPERSQVAVGGPTIIEVVQEGTRVIDDDGTPTSSGTSDSRPSMPQ